MFKLTRDTIKSVQAILGYINQSAHGYRGSLQERGLLVQQYIEKASDRTENTMKGRYINQILKNKEKIGGTEIATCKINIETAQAYLAGIFLTGQPIFQSVTDRSRESASNQINVLTRRDQDMYGWVRELLKCHKDVLAYPICAAEVTWKTQKVSSVVTASVGTKGVGAVQTAAYSGNCIKRIDPNNLIIDTSVPPHKVHTEGTFAGYVENLSYVQTKQNYNDLDPTYIIHINKEAIWKDKPLAGDMQRGPANLYYKPLVHSTRSNILGSGQDNHWAQFWGGNDASKANSNTITGMFEWTTLYVRIPLKDFGYTQADDGIHVCKLVYINGWLAYFEPLLNSHGLFPIVIGQVEDGDIHTTSYIEYILDLQDLGTAFMAASMASLRRAVSDRALYDPTRIAPDDAENPNPSHKIKVQMNQYQATLESAYKPIPYTDTVTPIMTQMIGFVETLANKTNGQNPASQGTFVKGNKTQFEFDTIMNNSEARMQLGALFLENHFYSGIKHILRTNYLLYAVADEIPSDTPGQAPTTIDPIKLRQEAPYYNMASGIMPSTKIASTELLVQAFTLMRQDPKMAMDYDTIGMLTSILQQQGLTGLQAYLRTPEQKQAYIAEMQALMNPQPQPASAPQPEA